MTQKACIISSLSCKNAYSLTNLFADIHCSSVGTGSMLNSLHTSFMKGFNLIHLVVYSAFPIIARAIRLDTNEILDAHLHALACSEKIIKSHAQYKNNQ